MQKLLSSISAWQLFRSYDHQKAQFTSSTGEGTQQLKRVERALLILIGTEYEITVIDQSPLKFEVKGPRETYEVTTNTCTCYDSEKTAMLCKHRIAVKLILDALRLQKKEKSKGVKE